MLVFQQLVDTHQVRMILYKPLAPKQTYRFLQDLKLLLLQLLQEGMSIDSSLLYDLDRSHLLANQVHCLDHFAEGT